MIRKTKPNLTLLIGSAGSGKTHFCTQAFVEALRKSKNPLADDLLFILPTAEHRARTIDLVLRKELGGFFQRRITTFDRSLHELLRLGGLEFASDVMRRMILSEILSRVQLDYFQTSAQTRGFLELVSRVIVEFKDQLIRPDELKQKLEEIKKQFPEFAAKYDDLSQIYEAYDEELKKRGLIDQRDSLRLLEEGLNRGEFKDPQLKRVWIDGFSDFSKLQLAFIEFLTRHADEVTATLTLDSNPYRKALFETVSRTQAALLDMGFQLRELKDKNHRSLNSSLEHLERHLFSRERPNKAQPDPAIQIFEATGFQGEMEMVAREIKRIVGAFGYHFSDIAVLFRTTDPYIPVIQSVFRKFEIPYELHERFRLRLSPIARTVLSFLETLLNDWPRRDLFNFLKSVSKLEIDTNFITGQVFSGSNEAKPVPVGTGTVHIHEISELELQALEKGICRDRSFWLESFPESKALRQIAHFEDQFLKLKSAAQFAEWLKGVLKHFGLLEFDSKKGQVLDADLVPVPFLGENANVNRESAKRLFLLLEELKNKTQRTEGLDPKNMARDFIALVDVDLYSVHSRDMNRVQIYNVSLARQKEYKAVFLAGLLERQFPIQIKEDPILSDLERRALNEKGEVLMERLPRQAFERYLFYMGATRARERLVLSFPRFDLEGKEALPSFYVEEVKGLFEQELPIKKQHVTEALLPIQEISSTAEAESLVVQELWALPKAESGGLESELVLGVYNELIHQSADFKSFIQRLLEPIQGVLKESEISVHFLPKSGVWSPTYLEEYAECPYRFFAHRGLNLESQTEGIDIRRRGIILHDVLERFFTWWRDRNREGKETNFEEAEAFCAGKFKELWEEEPLRGDRHYKIELERKYMLKMILQVLRTELIEKKSPIPGLHPAYFEYEFGDLTVKGKAREIRLRGKIDRIDTDPDGRYGLVIDYKTGKQFKMSFLEKGVFLQLPFYLIAAREKLGLKPLGGHLYSLAQTKSSGFHHEENLAEAGIPIARKTKNYLSGKDFEKYIEYAILFTERFVGEIEKARIPVRPRDCVSYCPYSAVCRIEKWRLDHLYQEIAEEDKEWLAEQNR